MPELLSASVEYGGYISIVKFVIFLILFFLWLLLISWVHEDARVTGTNTVLWTAVIFCTAVAAMVIWLAVPVFIIGMLLYLIAVGVGGISYVSHRNSRVLEF